MQGRRLADRYELDSLIGRGGMAEVWRATDRRLHRPVAVKILNQLSLGDPAALERFRREALVVGRVTHPNIVAAYDFGTEDDRPYLVMELVTGQTLHDRIADGPLPIAEATRVAAQIAAALDAAHRAGVVHRDIKPQNVIVLPDGLVKVLDFGIARLQEATGGLTRTATVVGTSHYMAPEQASGQPADGRTDLYALGCVLYAMLTGAPPFPDGNAMTVLYQHLHQQPRPIRELRPEVPAALSDLVTRLLAKRPADRPESAAEVRRQLEQLNAVPGSTAVYPTMPVPGAGGTAGSAAGRASVPRAPEPTVTSYFPVEPDTPSTEPPLWRRWPVLVSAGVVGVIVVSLLVLALTSDTTNTATPQTSPSPSPSSSAPSPSPEPTATTPRGRLDELHTVIDNLTVGEIDPKAVTKLNDKIDKIADAIDEGKLDRAAKQVEELRRELMRLANDGLVSDGAYTKISEAVNRLAEVLPAADTDDGPGPDRGKDKKKKGKDHDRDDD